MNILYYDARKIKWPEPNDSDEDDRDRGESKDYDRFISIGKDQKYDKGHSMDIYVSIVTDVEHKLIIHVNE